MLPENLGLDFAVLGSVISIIGVIYNNLFHAHILAMQIWCISNLILVIYFTGRWRDWWDGGLSDGVMVVMYVVMLISEIYGLVI